jgi:hypothetical protein
LVYGSFALYFNGDTCVYVQYVVKLFKSGEHFPRDCDMVCG